MIKLFRLVRFSNIKVQTILNNYYIIILHVRLLVGISLFPKRAGSYTYMFLSEGGCSILF